MRALVIDDSKTIRMLLSHELRSLAAEVVMACDGVEGLARMQEGKPFDLVLLDWNMPNMNGPEFLAAVRAERRFDGTRIIMVTTESELEAVQFALSAGADEFVMKPFTREILLEKLALAGLELP